MRSPRFRWFRHQFKLADVGGVLAVRSAKAIGASVTAADNHHTFACRQNLTRNLVALANLVGLRQKLHREVDTLQFTARHLQIAGLLSAAREQNRIEVAPELTYRQILTHMSVY